MRKVLYVMFVSALGGGVAGAERQPPPELTALANAEVGTWACSGSVRKLNASGTLTIKFEMNWWLHSTFDGTSDNQPLHFETYTSWFGNSGDPTFPRHWQRTTVTSDGSYATGESTAETKDGKLDVDLTGHSPGGKNQLRDHEDASDPKAGLKLSRAYLYAGKASPVYDFTCTRSDASKAPRANDRAEANAAQAAKDAQQAREVLDLALRDLDAINVRIENAVDEVVNAKSDADREKAKAKLAQLQKDQAAMKTRVAAAKAAAEKAERAKGVQVTKACLDNPLAKGCS